MINEYYQTEDYNSPDREKKIGDLTVFDLRYIDEFELLFLTRTLGEHKFGKKYNPDNPEQLKSIILAIGYNGIIDKDGKIELDETYSQNIEIKKISKKKKNGNHNTDDLRTSSQTIAKRETSSDLSNPSQVENSRQLLSDDRGTINQKGELLGWERLDAFRSIRDRNKGTGSTDEGHTAIRSYPKNSRNFIIPENYPTTGNRLQENLAALETLSIITQQEREATEEEKILLNQYSGFGGLTSILDSKESSIKSDTLNRLFNVIDQFERAANKNILKSIRKSVLTAYYTPPEIIRGIYDILETANFTGGQILEPSMGIGNFLGTMPEKFKNNSSQFGVELDYITGSIARLLYPDTDIRICGLQETLFANNSFNLVIGNIPFGDLHITDNEWSKSANPVYKFAKQRIHNYFVVKNIELAKEGGLIAFITTTATLDTPSNDLIRRYIAEKTEFLGAIRLPDTTFKSSNTKVTADILFLRKFYQDDEKKQKYNFLELVEGKFPSIQDATKSTFSYNKYFCEHADMMLGKPISTYMHGTISFGLAEIENHLSLREQIADKARQIIPSGFTFGEHIEPEKPVQDILERYSEFDTYMVHEGNLVLQKGKLGIIRERFDKDHQKQLIVEPFEFKGIKDNRINYFIRLRTSLTHLMLKELYDSSDEELEGNRIQLNSDYQSFVSLFGELNSTVNRFIRSDADGYSVLALEKLNKKGEVIGLADIFTKRTVNPIQVITSADSPEQAILISLNETGRISPSKMEVLLGKEWLLLCKGLIFELPDSPGKYVTKEEYLSGKVRFKLTQAKGAAEIDSRFCENVEALKVIQPQDIPASLIDIRLGARWIPTAHYTDFFTHLFSVPPGNNAGRVIYNSATDTYFIEPSKSNLETISTVFAAGGENGITIGEAALQDRHLQIFSKNEEGKVSLNVKATQAVEEKVQEIKLKFSKWLSSDQARLEKLARLYNDIFNASVKTTYNGSHLSFPGYIGPSPRPHQKDTVFRILQQNGCLCDQFPGSGKTLEMILAAMEMRRIGIANKPMIISLKTPVPQIAAEFRNVYPFAKVLAPSEDEFSFKKRHILLGKIATNDWDVIILSHEQYCQLDHDPEIEEDVINEELYMLKATIEELETDGSQLEQGRRLQKNLEKRMNNLEARIEEILNKPKDKFTFEKLGIDHLFVDESHEFKNLAYSTKHNNVAGLGNPAGSQKSKFLLMGCRALQKKHGDDKGITFLSGTPISNSLVELYLIFVYLRPNLLKEMGIVTLDAWASIFAERSSEFEFSVTGELKSRDRFRRYCNTPELSQMYVSFADVRTVTNLKLPKPDLEVEIVHVKPSKSQLEYMKEIIKFAQEGSSEKFNLHGDKMKKAKMLIATNLSAKIAMDLRLIDPKNEDESSSKISQCAQKVAQIYRETDKYKAVQLVFCDIGTPSEHFNVYDELKRKLVEEYNIPEKEIAFIHEASNNAQRVSMFNKISNQEIRITIGSTKKLGTGSNIQEWIACSHHLDVPWTPSAFHQRNGRVARQGNLFAERYANNKVKSYVYAVEQSLDAYKYQLLEIKQNLINQIKEGSITERYIDEGASDNNSVNFAEFVAILSGNPIIIEKANIDKDIHKLLLSERIFKENQFHIQHEIITSETKLHTLLHDTNCGEIDFLYFQKNGFRRNVDGSYNYEVNIDGKIYKKPGEAGEALLAKVNREEFGKVLSGFGVDLYLQKNDLKLPQYIIHSPSGLVYGNKNLSVNPTHAGMAIITAIEQAERLVEKKKQIPELEKQIDILKSTLIENWPDEDKLQQLISRQKEINQELAEIEKQKNNTIDISYEEIKNNPDITSKEPISEHETVQSGANLPTLPSNKNYIGEHTPSEITTTSKLTISEKAQWIVRLSIVLPYEEYKAKVEPLFKPFHGFWHKKLKGIIFPSSNQANEFSQLFKYKIINGEIRFESWKTESKTLKSKMKI